MNQGDALAPAGWLDGQTIAIVSAVLTVGVGIGAMVFASTSSIRDEVSGIRDEVGGLATKLEDTRNGLSAEIETVRSELRGEIEILRSELRGEIKATRLELRGEIKATRLELRDDIKGLDARLRNVETDVAAVKARLPVRLPVTRGTSPLDDEGDDADA